MVEAWAAWARGRGLDPHELDSYVHGRRTREVVARFAPGLDPDAEAARFEAEFADAYGARMTSIDPVCALYRSLAPGRRAVVTSATRAGAVARMDGLGLDLEVLVAAEDVAEGKPSPEGYVAGARELGLDPGESIVLEDSPPGIAAGRAAGSTVIAVTTTHDPGELSEADHIVGPGDLPVLAERLLGDGLPRRR